MLRVSVLNNKKIMNKIILVLSLVLLQTLAIAQCLSGDCKDGFGKYDYGFAIYEGNFINEKPNGKGTMDYGNGEKFVGNFKNGQEDGDGILYKNNLAKNVNYSNGKMKIKEKSVVIGGNIPTVAGCEKGDCYNGFGIVKFDSGNRYEGNFENGIKSGEGKFYFAGGNVFTGTFKDNTYTNGVFKYAQEQITFDGNYNDDGSPKTGKYYYATNKATVLVENGNITKIDNPVADEARRKATEDSKPKPCYNCSGVGMIAGVDRREEVESYYSINYVNSAGNTVGTSSGNVSKSMRTVRGWPTECKACRGTGQLLPASAIIINGGRF